MKMTIFPLKLSPAERTNLDILAKESGLTRAEYLRGLLAGAWKERIDRKAGKRKAQALLPPPDSTWKDRDGIAGESGMSYSDDDFGPQ